MGIRQYKTKIVCLVITLLWPSIKSERNIDELDENIKVFDNSMPESNVAIICQENQSLPWCIPSNFNTHTEPWKFKHLKNLSLPWNYHYTFNILEVREINDRTQTIRIVMYFRIKWMEPRIKIEKNHSDWSKTAWKDGGISYPSEILRHVWYPDLELERIEGIKSHSFLKEMSNVLIYNTNHIKYGSRTEITISCQMDFDQYPLDSQKCPFQVFSYFSTESDVSCTSEFTYDETKQQKHQYYISIKPLPNKYRAVGDFGNKFAACGFYISLDRGRVQIFFQVYLMSILFVIVSWVSFLISPEIVPGRMGLLVTVFLVLVNIFNAQKSVAPLSDNLNAVDLYLIFCVFLVFLALSEYAILLLKNHRTTVSVSPRAVTVNGNSSKSVENFQTTFQTWMCKNKLDAISLAAFPIIFIIFNIIYWVIHF
jgi:hypothetical protein